MDELMIEGRSKRKESLSLCGEGEPVEKWPFMVNILGFIPQSSTK